MNVCVVTHKLIRTDGQGRVNAEVVAAMARAGHRVDVIATEMGPEFLEQRNVTWHPVPVPRWLPSKLLKYQVFALRAALVLRGLRDIDIVQLNGAIVYGGRGGVNVANFVHSDWIASAYHPSRTAGWAKRLYQWLFSWLNARWERRAFRRAQRVVAVSDQVRHALVNCTGIDPASIEVITPGVDVEQYRPLQTDECNVLRQQLGLPANDFVLLFVGDIRSNRKNLDLVLRAMLRLAPNVHLVIAGDAARSPYPALSTSLGLAERTHFLGHKGAELAALMRGADAVVFPSHYDPFGLVVTEAMASGLPVITATTVGASSLIQDGQNGFVLPISSDVEGLVNTIADLLGNPTRRAAVGLAARKTAEMHSWATMASRYEELYLRILAERQGRELPAVTLIPREP
jgi:glycosyltransferase involved in cell wall biosynthesis